MANRIDGQIVSIDDVGNLISYITADQLEGVPTDDRVAIVCDEHKTTGIFSVNHSQPEMTLLAMIGDGETLQLAIVGESARIMLGVDAGAKIAVHWT